MTNEEITAEVHETELLREQVASLQEQVRWLQEALRNAQESLLLAQKSGLQQSAAQEPVQADPDEDPEKGYKTLGAHLKEWIHDRRIYVRDHEAM